MLSAVIATSDSERALVQTLACLVPGVTAGILRDVIVADAGSRDATAEVADIPGWRKPSASSPMPKPLRTLGPRFFDPRVRVAECGRRLPRFSPCCASHSGGRPVPNRGC